MTVKEPETSRHHLFTYYEVRAKLIEIFGEPKSDAEHSKLHSEIKRVRKMMPVYTINHELHKKIHSK